MALSSQAAAPSPVLAFDVLVLVASAGAEGAIGRILADLPPDLGVPILLMQHLPPGSSVVELYRQRSAFDLEWASEGSLLAPGKVLVCPPRSFVELLPDGSCRLAPCPSGAMQLPMNRLLVSVARSFAHRAIGVVLTGMGADGAAGARELHVAGGRVIVQSVASAQSPDMPQAAIAAGAADLVVPLPDIAQVITELVAGTPRPKARSELDAIRRVFGESGELAAQAREIDWALTQLGSVISWPVELLVMARTAVESAQPTAVWWGPDLIQIYNEPWRRFLGASRHPEALGRPARESWLQIWEEIGPMVERVVTQGVSTAGEDLRIVTERGGHPEEVYFTFVYSPIRDASGAVVGVHHTAFETTARVVAERRLASLRELSAQVAAAGTPREVCEHAAIALASAPLDLPFALLYLFDKACRQATLAGAVGLAAGSPAAPHLIQPFSEQAVWPLERVLEKTTSNDGVLLRDWLASMPELSLPALSARERLHPCSALLLPLRPAKDARPSGALVVGLNPQRPFDDAYHGFVGLVAKQIKAGILEARAKELERERTDRLAELDRAKTEFFANVSHEFRTPLTLLLTPLEELLRRSDELPGGLVGEIEVAARNSRRLLRLVNNLLDFSELEARHQRTPLEPTDLGALTSDVASAFRAAIESAGLRLNMSCDPKLPLVPVNREMWEKIVSNLLSNALKFTFEGEIAILLRARSLHAEVVVSDTGIGIPAEELPNIFKRFHRIHGAKARTLEGSGIGLAIVHDLVGRMGGQLAVRSIEERGTSFTIWLPYKLRLPQQPDTPTAAAQVTGLVAADLADEASRWIAGGNVEPDGVAEGLLGAPEELPAGSAPPAGRVLLVDDNADLRDYLRRLLSPRWNVDVAGDGTTALALTRRLRPDIVLADVLMPGLDGFALLREIRGDPALKHTPVILLTARAGEESAVEGLIAGADDYIAKPFSPRELVARLRGQVELSRMRRRNQELNAFLVRFSDAVRGLAEPRAVADTACRMLVEQLGAERSHWSEVDWATREYVVESRFLVDGVADTTAGRHPLDDREPSTSILLSGQTMTIGDPNTDLPLPGISVPVTFDGKLRAVLAVSQSSPRRWTADEVSLVENVAGRCWAEVERSRAEALLRAREERKAFLLQLSDALRPLTDAVEMKAAANRLLGEHLRTDRTYYVELDPDRGLAVLERDYVRGDAPSLAGEHPLAAFEATLASHRSGKPFVCDDALVEPRIRDADRPAYLGRKLRSFVTTPLIKGGEFVGAMSVTHSEPRAWRSDEVALVVEVAERTWDAVQRAHVEAALRANEARQAFLLKLSDALRPLSDAREIRQTAMRMVGKHFRVARVLYEKVEPNHLEYVIPGDAMKSGAEKRPEPLATHVFPSLLQRLSLGETLVISDVRQTSTLTDAEKDAAIAAEILAFVCVPLLKDGRLVARLGMQESQPRRWTSQQLALLQGTAERMWAAVERSRAEAALAHSERERELADTKRLQAISRLAADVIVTRRE
jgi:signal transduction histidine kinase/chemotaxis response regulator CheB/transcriptional regulator with GAF, ATPase, and Fis domain